MDTCPNCGAPLDEYGICHYHTLASLLPARIASEKAKAALTKQAGSVDKVATQSQSFHPLYALWIFASFIGTFVAFFWAGSILVFNGGQFADPRVIWPLLIGFLSTIGYAQFFWRFERTLSLCLYLLDVLFLIAFVYSIWSCYL